MKKGQYGFNANISGKRGESMAIDYLVLKGFEIVATNYRFKRAEIDLIGIQESVLVFIEVKLRSNLKFGNPETFIDASKQNRIKKAAESYIFEKNWLKDIRFDVVSIVEMKEGTEIEHFIDCF